MITIDCVSTSDFVAQKAEVKIMTLRQAVFHIIALNLHNRYQRICQHRQRSLIVPFPWVERADIVIWFKAQTETRLNLDRLRPHHSMMRSSCYPDAVSVAAGVFPTTSVFQQITHLLSAALSNQNVLLFAQCHGARLTHSYWSVHHVGPVVSQIILQTVDIISESTYRHTYFYLFIKMYLLFSVGNRILYNITFAIIIKILLFFQSSTIFCSKLELSNHTL